MPTWLRNLLRRPAPTVEYQHVRRGDSFVIQSDQVLRAEQRDAITRAVAEFQTGHRTVLALDGGLRLTVVRFEDRT